MRFSKSHGLDNHTLLSSKGKTSIALSQSEETVSTLRGNVDVKALLSLQGKKLVVPNQSEEAVGTLTGNVANQLGFLQNLILHKDLAAINIAVHEGNRLEDSNQLSINRLVDSNHLGSETDKLVENPPTAQLGFQHMQVIKNY